jgi:ELWxxDGT repeat protein
VVFNACDAHGCEVWASDGTEAGTRRVADVEPGATNSNPIHFTPSGPLVLFAAQMAETGNELWAFPKSALFDADADGVTDADDNCPAAPNPDQADLDGDGAGDACDEDRDGDGVANAADLCPGSPLDGRVNREGCTAEELVALRCPREESSRHGRYVSCVAHAAQEAVRDGLIGPAEKARLVKRAAQEK